MEITVKGQELANIVSEYIRKKMGLADKEYSCKIIMRKFTYNTGVTVKLEEK